MCIYESTAKIGLFNQQQGQAAHKMKCNLSRKNIENRRNFERFQINANVHFEEANRIPTAGPHEEH